MPAFQKTFKLSMRGHCDVHDITGHVGRIVGESGIRIGIVNVAGTGSTLGIGTIEFEPGAVADLRRALDQIAPENEGYKHNERWGDHNGFAHLRSALMGTARTYPVSHGGLHLGTWQQIILCDFDDRPREREIMVTVIGD